MSATIESELIRRVLKGVRDYCHTKGAREGPGVNNLVPHDCISAHAMAKYLVRRVGFSHYIAVAPEGHIYGYFFSRLGVHPLTVSVDYPPTVLAALDDLSNIHGGNVLIIEDDVVGGSTLRIVVSELTKLRPRSLSLFLGHAKLFHHLENIPREIKRVYRAEDVLSADGYPSRAKEFMDEFRGEVE